MNKARSGRRLGLYAFRALHRRSGAALTQRSALNHKRTSRREDAADRAREAMTDIAITWKDKDALLKVKAAAAVLSGPKKLVGLRRAINHTGDKAYTQVRRVISKRTSVPPMSLDKYGAMQKRPATGASLTYEIRSSGKGIPYKVMGARQTRAGVSVMAWGRRFLIPHAFLGQGSLNGNVFVRRSSSRLPLKALTGPSIPKELIKHYVEHEFGGIISRDLPARVVHEVRVITGGVLT